VENAPRQRNLVNPPHPLERFGLIAASQLRGIMHLRSALVYRTGQDDVDRRYVRACRVAETTIGNAGLHRAGGASSSATIVLPTLHDESTDSGYSGTGLRRSGRNTPIFELVKGKLAAFFIKEKAKGTQISRALRAVCYPTSLKP